MKDRILLTLGAFCAFALVWFAVAYSAYRESRARVLEPHEEIRWLQSEVLRLDHELRDCRAAQPKSKGVVR